MCLCVLFAVDIVDVLVVTMCRLCEDVIMIVSLDSCTSTVILNKFSILNK